MVDDCCCHGECAKTRFLPVTAMTEEAKFLKWLFFRNLAVGSCSTFARVGSMAAPYVVMLVRKSIKFYQFS